MSFRDWLLLTFADPQPQSLQALCNIHRDRHSGLANRKIKEQNAIYDSVAGIVFMGTPHAGSHVADAVRIKLLKAIARATFKKPPEKLITALSAHSPELQDLSDSFENTTIFTQHVIEICTYYETMTQKFAGEEVRCLLFVLFAVLQGLHVCLCSIRNLRVGSLFNLSDSPSNRLSHATWLFCTTSTSARSQSPESTRR